MSPFRRDLLPPSVQDWLPESHLARFVVEVVSKLDLGELERAYAGRGSKAYHPEMLLAMLFYGYATGVFSSRKQEQATYDSVAFRYIAANTHRLARTMGFLNLGKISLDGSKVKANASKHSALSWGHATELGEQLKAEVARLMEMAAAADADVPEGMDIPSELKRREDRLKAIAAAKVKLEARAAERHSPNRPTEAPGRWGLLAISLLRAGVDRKTSTSVSRRDLTRKTHRCWSQYGWYRPLASHAALRHPSTRGHATDGPGRCLADLGTYPPGTR